jgi:hypothetical protein
LKYKPDVRVLKLRSQSNQPRSHIRPELRYNWYLHEDNDPSHGTKNPDTLHQPYKLQRGILTYEHPANSPDLNPIEGIWNIIKQRVRQYLDTIQSITDFKAALQAQWKKVGQEMAVYRRWSHFTDWGRCFSAPGFE